MKEAPICDKCGEYQDDCLCAESEPPVAGSATCSPKLLVTLREVLKLVRRIRDYDPHPSHCDHIHLHATEAIEMLEIAISENAKGQR